jgi:CRAL/TRIO domain
MVAIERLEATLRWRREFGIYDLTAEQVEPEVSESRVEHVFLTRFVFFLYLFAKAVTGKQFVFGYDTHRRPALYMVPSRQNTEESPRQVQFVFWMLERALDLTGPGVE